MPAAIPVALTIAGSDSGGGAGLQADLRTFAFHQVHGTCALTCVTAQNTCTVDRVEVLSPALVVAQVEAVVSDIGINALKTGLLPTAEVMTAIATLLPTLKPVPMVIDPVMVTRAGDVLLAEDAIATLKDHLIPQATILTPNRYEAQMLSGQTIETLSDMEQAAQAIHALGPQAVLVKGGGCPGELRGVDVWFDGQQLEILSTERVETRNTHGTGCTLSAAITAQLACGQTPLAATQAAKQYVTTALRYALDIGKGQGPVGHWFPLIDATA